MREILFRGKQKYNGEWIISGNVFFGEKRKYMYFHNPDNDPVERAFVCREVIPESIGQYTGLTDKNGKKIFEGDILNCITSDFDGSDKYVYNFKITNIIDYEQMGFLDFCNEVEIIGNIHDNPKLLKGGADNA